MQTQTGPNLPPPNKECELDTQYINDIHTHNAVNKQYVTAHGIAVSWMPVCVPMCLCVYI